jgi:GNAT superfamily N-acetyltransferase
MLTYRTFRNMDPPALAALWRSRAEQPGLRQPISPDLLEQLVFAKLYFDCEGLILAFDEGRPVGFAHAGFGPSEDARWISTESGATCMVLVEPGCDEAQAAAGLVERCEDYLDRRGAKVFYGGGLFPSAPFYVGLYGGSELPGILDSDTVARAVFADRGYREVERTTLLDRELNEFKSLEDRRQMQIRRQMTVEVATDAPASSWWEASIFGDFELTRFAVTPRGGRAPVATAAFRSMTPGGLTAAMPSVGLIGLSVDAAYRRRGMAMFLLREAFRHFLQQGIAHIEAQTRENDPIARGISQKLGFQPIAEGGVWRKEGT